MHLSLLSPLGLFVALAMVVPIIGLAIAERRAAAVGRLLELTQPDTRRRVQITVSLALVATLLGFAAAQPVIGSSQRIHVNEDAEALFVFDVSKSMSASPRPGAPTRLDRAKELGLGIRSQLGGIQAGAAALTRRVLPYLFPTADEGVFDATVQQAVRIESPPPGAPTFAQILNGTQGLATDLTGLASVPSQSFFTPRATHRLVIVLTDGESSPVQQTSLRSTYRFSSTKTHLIIVRVWKPGEQIFNGDGLADPKYRSTAESFRITREVAVSAGGRAFDEGDVGAIVRAARADLRGGHVVSRRVKQTRRPLAAWFTGAAALPLLLVLWRRNL